jgi:hypothetical protein
MKNVFMFAGIIAFLSIAYYFAIFLPKTARNSTHDLEMQEKCSKLAKNFFDEQGYIIPPDSPTYECHYNRKLNKCFILITNEVYLHNAEIHTINCRLIDLLSNKQFGQSTFTSDQKGSLPCLNDIIPDGICSAEVWNKRIKEYMQN